MTMLRLATSMALIAMNMLTLGSFHKKSPIRFSRPGLKSLALEVAGLHMRKSEHVWRCRCKSFSC